jgi:hypothetical protein
MQFSSSSATDLVSEDIAVCTAPAVVLTVLAEPGFANEPDQADAQKRSGPAP